MENLYIDIGNSYFKAAEKIGLQWKLVFREKIDRRETFISWLGRQADEKRFVVCSVQKEIDKELMTRFDGDNLVRLTYRDIPLEMMQYKTPKTLGMDRFVSCLGASEQTPGAIVVIDAGTACTIDYMSKGSVFFGGVIMPGLQVLLESLSRNMASLPEADEILPNEWPGKSSIDSVRWGTTGVFIESIRGFLEKYREAYGEFDLFLTGGGAGTIQRYLGDDYDIKLRQHLVFEGMQAFSSRYLTDL